MTLAVETARYGRVEGLLWRDTGQHVLVLPAGARAKVVVLGGGGAAVWRLLGLPLSVGELMGEFTSVGGARPPTESELVSCLGDLASNGIVTESREQA